MYLDLSALQWDCILLIDTWLHFTSPSTSCIYFSLICAYFSQVYILCLVLHWLCYLVISDINILDWLLQVLLFNLSPHIWFFQLWQPRLKGVLVLVSFTWRKNLLPCERHGSYVILKHAHPGEAHWVLDHAWQILALWITMRFSERIQSQPSRLQKVKRKEKMSIYIIGGITPTNPVKVG
jgi:hypothetical protein